MDVVRGTQASFEATFTDLGGSAMVPTNADQYPQIIISDAAAATVTTSVGSSLGSGKYKFLWFVPETASLTTNTEKWTIQWIFVTSSGHTATHVEEFSIVDKIESTPEELSQTFLSRDGGTFRVLIRRPTQLYKVALTIKTQGGIIDQVNGIATTVIEKDSGHQNRLIQEKVQDGEYVYFYDTDALSIGEYYFFWDIQESEVSEINTDIQVGRVVPDVFWHYATELRILVDKLQKKAGTLQAYSSADLYSYLLNGLDMVNFIYPTTNFRLTEIPLSGSRGLRTAIIYASAIDALHAQQIMEVELSFDHSGQTVTLSYNHDYSGILASLQGMLDKFAEGKKHLKRIMEGAAYSGARVRSYRSIRRVHRLDRSLTGFATISGGGLYAALGL